MTHMPTCALEIKIRRKNTAPQNNIMRGRLQYPVCTYVYPLNTNARADLLYQMRTFFEPQKNGRLNILLKINEIFS